MGQRLLVVDNDRAFLDEHKAALEAAFEVEYLSSTDGAMPRLEMGGIAAVLICVEVSENKGYALCSAIRRSPGLQDLKVLLISAKATEEEYTRHQSLKGRADFYMHKPMETSVLVASLAPFVPARPADSDHLLDDLEGADLGEEWLESLKSELDVDFSPIPERTEQPESAFAFVPPTTVVLPEVALDQRIQELEHELQNREALLEAKERELEGLRSLGDASTRNLDMEGQIQDLDRLQALEGAHAAAEEELARVRESLALSQERVQALECQAGTQVSAEEKERELNFLRQDVAGLEGTLRGQRRELADQGMRLQALDKEAVEMRTRTEEAEGRAAASASQLDEVQTLANTLQTELQAATTRIQEQTTLLAEAENRGDDLELQNADLRSRLEQSEAEREVSRTDLEECQLRLSQAETDLAEKSTIALRQIQELTALGEQFEAARSTRDRQAEELTELRGNLESLESQLLARQNELDVLRIEREQLQGRCAELEANLAQSASEHEAQRMELLVGLDEREVSLSRANVALESLQAQVLRLESEKRELDGNLNERTARLDSLTGVISDLEAGIRRASDLTRPF